MLFLFAGPIRLPEDYHNFADQRSVFLIPNFLDVVSNVPFAVLGIYGFCYLARKKRGTYPRDFIAKLPFLGFFLAIIFVMLGSGYYHWAPADGPLLYDRVPIVIAFMCLFSGFLSDRLNSVSFVLWGMPCLIVLSLCSLGWDLFHAAKGGDLIFYLFVQVCPIVILPIICRLYSRGRLTTEKHLWQMIGWYVLAKFFEYFDPQIFSLTLETLSGRTLKHLAASMAVLSVICMLKEKMREDP
ncbi:MAG: hypothetical protein VW557_12925 [Rhodospirillaceae bacterium]